MKKAYVILSHKQPDMLIRLISRLDDDCSDFFVHLDKKISSVVYDQIRFSGNRIKMVERVYCEWGGFGIVQATLNGLKMVLENNTDYERIILLSGQDYPIKKNSYIDEFFRSSRFSIFLEYFEIPNHYKWEDDGGLYRTGKYFFGMRRYQRLISKTLNLMGIIFPFAARKIPGKLKPYAGSQWWTLDMDAIRYIFRFIETHPWYTSFHKATFASDELFFQMILLNATDETLLQKISNDHIRFMRWKTPGASHPEIIRKANLGEVVSSTALFARKFDLSADAEILELIDQDCL